MECENCGAILPEDTELCPECGQPKAPVITPETGETPDVPETPEAPAKKKVKWWQIALLSVAGVILLLCLSVVVYWGATGVQSFDEGIQSIVKLVTPRENNVYYKDSYSVSDEKAYDKRDQVVATVGTGELTNGELQVYYWTNFYDFLENYGYYAVYYGLDYTQPLDEQSCKDNNGTWQQYFLSGALDSWHNYQAMALMAQEEGMTLSDDMKKSLEELRSNLTAAAVEGGFASINEMLQADMGPGCTYEAYEAYMQTYYAGYQYFGEKYEAFEVTDDAIEKYFKENEETLKTSGITKESGNLVDVRHILVGISGGTKDEKGNVTYSDEDWEACRAKAQKLLDEWLAGDATEDTFAALAVKHSEDTGSAENGGLYQNLNADSGMVKEFTEWYMNKDRKAGDYGLVKTEYGYHIMYFSAAEAEWIRTCREEILSDWSADLLKTATEKYPMDVKYKNIVLGVVDFSEE